MVSSIAAMVVLLALAGCSGGDVIADPPPTSRPPTTGAPSTTDLPATDPPATETPATDPPATPTSVDPADEAFTPDEREVIAAYRAARDAILAAGSPPESNPDHPALAETMVDPQLEVVRKAAAADRAEGVIFRLPDQTRRASVPRTVVLDSETAEMVLCSVDDTLTVDHVTGEVVDGSTSVSEYKAGFVRIDGRWMLASRVLIRRLEGDEASCAR